MKCPKCGTDGDGKFCQGCGTKLVVKTKVVICLGKDDDGNLCNAEISSDKHFCKHCGHPVDPARFVTEKCGKCGAECPTGQSLCATCGIMQTKVEAATSTEVKKTSQQEHSPVQGSVIYKRLNEPSKTIQNSEAINPQQPLQEQLPEGGSSTDTTENQTIVETIEHSDSNNVNQLTSTENNTEDIPALSDSADTVPEHEDKLASRQMSGMELDQEEPKAEIAGSNEMDVEPSTQEEDSENLTETLKPDADTNSISHDVTNYSGEDSDSDDDTNGPESIAGDEASNQSAGDKDSENRSKQGKKRRVPSKSKIKKKQKHAKKAAKLRSNNPAKQNEPNVSCSHDDRADITASKTDDVKRTDEPVFGIARRSKTKTNSGESFHVDTRETETEAKHLPTFFEDMMLSKSSHCSTSKSAMPSTTSDGGKINKNERNLKNQHNAKTDKNNSEARNLHDKDSVKVIFHVLVSRKLLEEESNKVLLRFNSPLLGEWTSENHVANQGRKFEKHIEYSYELQMPRQLLLTGVLYKYCVRNGSSTFKYEHYYDYTSHKEIHDRWLCVPKDMVSKRDLWHQYDGVAVQEPPKNVFHNFYHNLKGTFKKKSVKRMEKFTKWFCPDWFISGANSFTETFQEALEQLDSLVFGVRKVYFTHAKCFDSDPDFKRQVGILLFENAISDIQKQINTTEKRKMNFIRAVGIAISCNRIEIVLPQPQWQALCRSLLLWPDDETQSCQELEDVLTLSKKESLKRALVALVKCQSKFEKDPSWMFCLPLLHFVTNVCQPYDVLGEDLTHASKIPNWWGIVEIEHDVEHFKNSRRKWSIPLGEILTLLQPLFDMDPYLPRSIVAALEPAELHILCGSEVFPIEVCLAALLYWSLNTNPMYPSKHFCIIDITDYTEKVVCECLWFCVLRLQKYDVKSSESLTRWTMAYKIGVEGVEKMYESDRVTKIAYWCYIFVMCISIHSRISTTDDGMRKGKTLDYKSQISAVAGNAASWMSEGTKWPWPTKLPVYLKIWSYAFIPRDGDLCLQWNIHIGMQFQIVLRRQFLQWAEMKSTFIAFFCQNVENFPKHMQECLTVLASEAIDGGYKVDYYGMDQSGKQRLKALMTSLFEKKWKAGIQTEDDSNQILHMTLTWPPIQLFLKNKDEGTENQLLSKGAHANLNLIITICHSSWESLVNGNIEIGMLRLINSYVNVFSTVMIALLPKENAGRFVQTIQTRMVELEAFETQWKRMSVLVNHCQYVKVDTSEVDRILSIAANCLETQPLNAFCEPFNIDSLKDLTEPKLKAFSVPQKVLDILESFEQFEKSYVFERMWKAVCNKNGHLCKTLPDVVDAVWKHVENGWKIFGRKLSDGDILFQEFEKTFSAFDDLDERLVREITVFGISEDIACKRIRQLQEYRQLVSCVSGAQVLLKVQRKYHLQGNFKPIQKIAEHIDNQFKMKDFDDKLMEIFQVLKFITKQKVHCLEMFLQCDNLVQWLKESMKTSGQKELKVFVDLAMMSAGDEPMNIKKVQFLHSAVLGYSPLIFELNADCDYSALIDKCKVVWKELDANPNLPQQLIDTDRELPWLKEIKKAHGSVEVTSLMQADAINSDGVYTVGIITVKESSNDDIMTRDVIKLTVPEKEHERQFRSYSYSQLQDLQSRLMLVAGKSTQEKKDVEVDVEMFTLVFDSVTRLGNVFRKLCTTGCVLFNSWKATFMCNTTRRVCVILSFGEGNDVPKLKGGVSKTEGLQDVIPELAKFMEKCLEEWLDFIRSKRVEYFHLNYFTVDQLVILQRELVKVGSDKLPSNHIYPLLSAVRQDCTPADLVAALNLAREELDNRTQDRDVEMDTGTKEMEMNDDINTSELDEKKTQFVRELVSAGIDESLALRSIDYVDIKDIESRDVTQALLWCMDNGETLQSTSQADDKIDIDEIVEAQNPTQSFSGWNDSTSTMASIIKTNLTKIHEHSAGAAELIQGLAELWKSFLGSISSNISDYLSLEYLGIVLKHIAEQETVHRKLGTSFNEGEPNLIICPTEDIPKVTLSIYMHDKEQPLPSSDEVLICSSSTAKDEVDIFWRRAIYGDSQKIHCLVNADLLDYDVSEAAEQRLEEYILETKHLRDLKYRLFVICGSDNEYRCPFVSSLDKYVRQVQTVNPTLLKEYVADKLVVPRTRTQSASSVDFNRSSARVVKSSRAGVGKSLYVKRRAEALSIMFGQKSKTFDTKLVTIPLQEKHIDIHGVIQTLLQHTPTPGIRTARIFHIDISHEVQEGVDFLLFNLLILNCLVDRNGYVWRRSTDDLYVIETMPITKLTREKHEMQYAHPMFDILPDVTCRSPEESFGVYSVDARLKPSDYKTTDQLFDEKQFRSPVFQRTFQYLKRLDAGRNMNDINPANPEGDPKSCLQVVLRRCGVKNPSWSELHHFVWFLNTQLVDFELNQFVSVAAAEDLPGFATFVLRFLMQMSKDFSTRSLKISEESPGCAPLDDMNEEDEEDDDIVLNRLSLRRTWESSPHPYLFFNSDRFTFTFLGFFIERATGNLKDQHTGQLLEQSIMTQNLYDALVRNHAPLQESFDSLPRDQKIIKLCNIMGIEFPHDPDSTYELTTDNVKKIMAIYMRFRCDIPVIVMGETGCGKTRLVKFMCALQCPPGVKVKNMILMKVHGGTTKDDIKRKVHAAERIAKNNVEAYGVHMYTILFFDEANTTEAIGIIKEIMCDKSICGEPLKLCQNLKMIAACNPYRKHPEELIKKLEQAGLGYHVDADETTDRLGRVPMRRLVYRVQPLPQSLLPLVWDFGQLNTEVEKLYICQMVKRAVVEQRLPNKPGLVEVVSSVLATSQKYMRDQKDECSFVSLRDAERVLMVMAWFNEQANTNRFLFDAMDDKIEEKEEVDEEDEIKENGLDDLTRCLVLAIGVCYHACLKTRREYRETVAAVFREPCQLSNGADQILQEIEYCQEVFLDNVKLDDNIARNTALKENVFMMVVCIELRIPLFLVGKPGSSKSLAKTIVADAMQGNSARHQLFKHLKQVQMVSFQCSPLSTPDGIVGTFKQCAEFQKDKDPDTFVSVVVLDEVGLAEDSPRMPLKTLHPLLEDGCQGDETPERYKKVAFIGISNWALDPAKMNRGILVQREVPDLEELITSAKGICQTTEDIESFLEPFIEPLSRAYLKIFKRASDRMREFYGLRDFYSLVKMVYGFVAKNKRKPTWLEMLHAIKRNFGGLDLVDPEGCFKRYLGNVMHCNSNLRQEGPDCSAKGLIEACLFDSLKSHGESRYLLLLTDNYGALSIIQQQILSKRSEIRPITIFGSSFRSDQEYTQVCRNINKIKVCMETGNTVVLLNLENLYESLYDALNQYYVYFGGERYVDLGLGTHRVKCPVHKNFRLIVVAEKQTVYKKFPIPLINRLEKHFLAVNTILDERQLQLARELLGWTEAFAAEPVLQNSSRTNRRQTQVGEVFIGFHEDTCSAIVMDVYEKHAGNQDSMPDEQVLQEAKKVLLWCATPEAIYRENKLDGSERESIKRHYNVEQAHVSAIEYLKHIIEDKHCPQLFAQITCHSKLLAANHEKEISNTISSLQRVEILSLSSFDTEQQFSNRVQQHFVSTRNQHSLLVIQCDSGDMNSNLIACARYCVMDEFEKVRDLLEAPSHIAIIVQLPRKAGGCFTGFQCGVWHSVHIDDLYPEDTSLPRIHDIQDKAVSELFFERRQEEHFHSTELMEIGPGDGSPFGEPTRPNMELDEEPSGEIDPDIHESLIKKIKNMMGLIMKCVQPALAMVKDRVQFYQRETKRVEIVLNSLRSSDDQHADTETFVTGIIRWLRTLLKEKEKDGAWYLAKQWITRDAAAIDNINKNGTFRQSCYQTIVSKVKPVLAGIFAFLDTNSNLDIVVCDVSWKRDFWLKCLNHKDFLQMKYSDLQSPKRKSEFGEMIVPTTGFEGHQFRLRFPFSWLILETVETLFRDLVFEGDGMDRIDRCTLGLKSGATGQLISKLEAVLGDNQDIAVHNNFSPSIQEVLEDYIHDFVQTVYNAERESELNIVCRMLMFKTVGMCEAQGVTTIDLIRHIVCVRFAYEELSCRLAYFRSVNHIWPDCSAKIDEIWQSKPEHIMFKEHEFTYATLCLLIEELNPSPKDLEDRSEQQKWLEKVYRYRPVVDTILQLRGEDSARYGCHSFASVRRAKCMWSRVIAMKLFLENVCTKETKDDITIKHCRPLWVLLGDETDLKESKSFTAMEKFLKMCNKTAVKDSIGSEVRCCRCEELLQSAPISVPCEARHIICHTCCGEMKALLEQSCPNCEEAFEGNWKPVIDENRKIGNEKLEKYQKQCNTFFLEVVTQLCFADEEPPSEEVLGKLLGYVTCKSKDGKRYTKNMNIFDTGVDPNPVFRSFLLQLMMKSSKERYVSKYLSQFIEETSLVEEVKSKEMIDMYLLIIHCWEDTQLHCLEQSGESKSVSVSHSLENAVRVMNNSALHTDLLSAIATTRACLEVAAQCLERCLSYGASIKIVPPDDRKIIQTTKWLCENAATDWPKIYLVKLLCRRYGIDVYQRLSRSSIPIFKWLAIAGTEKQIEVCDRYIICGDIYTSIREAVARTVLGEDIQKLDELLQGVHARGEPVETYLQLAIHREITCSNVRQSAREPTHGLPQLREYVDGANMIQDKELTVKLLNNELLPVFLRMTPETDLMHQGLQCLLAHFYIVLSKLQTGSTLLDPLIMFTNGNPIIQNMLLPTMPQDDLEDIQAAVLANRGGDNPVFYRCPNGHPYYIGDCGRPYVVGNCPECRQQIGGTSHQALPGNVVNARGDSTQTGHILGRAIRGGFIRPERDLNPTYCTATRLFLHMAMYFGPVHQVMAVIKPDLEGKQVPGFLLDHIRSNINDLQRALGRSGDDVILLMHIAISIMMRKKGTRVSPSVARLSTKADRKAWETEFSSQILHDVLGNVDALITHWNNRLATDQRLGADPLMCLIYETDSSRDIEDASQLLDIPRMWRFRTPITVEHMCQDLESKGQEGKKPPLVLQRFMNEDCLLQALRYVPNIIRLQRALLQKYQKKLDKTEANAIKVKDLKKERSAGHETERWINDFACAWEITRKILEQYGCPTEFGRMYVPKEFCNQKIHDDTSLAVFLPATSGPGLCSYAMLDFLFRKQNGFLDSYIRESGRKDTRHPAIKPMAVTSAHLISYDHEHDLMPLVLANCHYSFEMGVGTKIEYDFAGMERQLMDRLLYSKSRIEFTRFLEIDQMIYRTEVTNQTVFMKLAERIPQVHLNGAVRTQICEELRRLPDVCRSLDNLDIAISFLKSTGGLPRAQLITFMVETLHIENAMLSQKARQCCELQHARALWLLLSFQKSKLLIDYRQSTEEVFETLQHDMYEDLDADLEAGFTDYMDNLSVDKLATIIEVMHEFLQLSVSIRQNTEDEDFIDTSRYIFIDGLREYVAQSEPALALDVATLEEFPRKIWYKHGAKAWVLAYTTLTRKLGNRRRY